LLAGRIEFGLTSKSGAVLALDHDIGRAAPHIEDTIPMRSETGRCAVRWSYSCPHCKRILNRDRSIMLIGTHGDEEIMFGFHPAPGNYAVSLPPGCEVEPGSKWDFACPLCHHSLESDISAELCCIEMVTKDKRHRVYFSRTAGERATFVISAEGIERHGEHADRHSLEILELV